MVPMKLFPLIKFCVLAKLLTTRCLTICRRQVLEAGGCKLKDIVEERFSSISFVGWRNWFGNSNKVEKIGVFGDRRLQCSKTGEQSPCLVAWMIPSKHDGRSYSFYFFAKTHWNNLLLFRFVKLFIICGVVFKYISWVFVNQGVSHCKIGLC